MVEFSSQELFDFLISEAEANFRGWDFSYLAGREDEELLPWSYVSQCLLRVRKARSVLDMDTGGGELFARFAPFPDQTFATEAYPPNIPVARERLAPLGVQVVAFEDEADGPLPFRDAQFDLILNRHGYYRPLEIGRLLQPGGVFVTQQVGDRNDIGIRMLLEAPDDSRPGEWDLAKAAADLEAAGLVILQQLEAIYNQRFYDVGALVYQLKAVSWQIPDFSVPRYFEALQRVHDQIRQSGYVDVPEHRFWIVAQKPQ